MHSLAGIALLHHCLPVKDTKATKADKAFMVQAKAQAELEAAERAREETARKEKEAAAEVAKKIAEERAAAGVLP